MEDVPELLGKNVDDADTDHVVDQYLKLRYQPNRKLTEKEVVEFN